MPVRGPYEYKSIIKAAMAVAVIAGANKHFIPLIVSFKAGWTTKTEYYHHTNLLGP
jgi:hypothetical protein